VSRVEGNQQREREQAHGEHGSGGQGPGGRGGRRGRGGVASARASLRSEWCPAAAAGRRHNSMQTMKTVIRTIVFLNNRTTAT